MKHLLLALVVVTSATVAADKPTRDLIDWKRAQPTFYPASVQTEQCSATIVSESVVLTASQCVPMQPEIRFTVGANEYTGICALSGKDPIGPDGDFALCETTAPVTGIPYESVNSDPDRVRVNDKVLLTG